MTASISRLPDVALAYLISSSKRQLAALPKSGRIAEALREQFTKRRDQVRAELDRRRATRGEEIEA